MMHTRPLRRVLVVLVAASMAALAACGDDNGDDDASTVDDTNGAAEESELTVTDVWARPAVDLAGSDLSAVYMQITGGDVDDELVSASVPEDIAAVVELHETRPVSDGDMGDGDMGNGDMGDAMDGDDAGMHSGVMEMVEVPGMQIPAGETVSLQPGGLHIMLIELQQELNPGDSIEVTLTFANAGEKTVTAEVREL